MAETKYSSTSLYRIGRRLALAVGSSLGISVETLSATKTLAADSALVQHLDPNGSNRNVVLPQGVMRLQFVDIMDGMTGIYQRTTMMVMDFQIIYCQG